MDHAGMNEHSARWLQEQLEPLLPEYVLTSVPWHSERGEWIVTVWDKDEQGDAFDALIDVFETPAVLGHEYVLLRVGSRVRVGRAATVADIPGVVRAALAASPR